MNLILNFSESARMMAFRRIQKFFKTSVDFSQEVVYNTTCSPKLVAKANANELALRTRFDDRPC
jgi:hypothetical protein